MRCLIVDDNERFLEAARSSLDGDEIDVVGTAATSEQALQRVDDLEPDIVLVDISLGRESGFELARALVERYPELRSRIILISTRSGEDYADMIESSPAVGFLSKSQLSAPAIRDLFRSAGA